MMKDSLSFGIAINIILSLVGQSSAFENKNEFLLNSSLADSTCSGNDVLFTEQPTSRTKCAAICENSNHCTGLTYRFADGMCVGCKDRPSRIASTDLGMNYFEPTGRKWRFPCDDQYVCTGKNQQCTEGACVCTPGYSFNFTSWTCVNGCVTYGDTFQKYSGYKIYQSNYEVTFNITLDECFHACQGNPICTSFEYNPTKPYCHLQNVTALDVPNLFKGVAKTDYYNRNC